MSLPALLNLKDEPTQSPFDKLSDDALAQVLASDIQNDPVGACQIIDNFCRARKCSDDFWMNVAAKLGVQDVVDSKMANNWTWRDTIRWWCEVLRYDTVQERFYAAAKYGYIDLMHHIAGKYWTAVGYVEGTKGDLRSQWDRRWTNENAYYTAMCIAASWGRIEALDWLKARWQILYGTKLKETSKYDMRKRLISYGISSAAGYSGDVATLEWCISNGWTDVGDAAWGVGKTGSIDAVKWVLERDAGSWEDIISGAAVTGAMEVLEYITSQKDDIQERGGFEQNYRWGFVWLDRVKIHAAQNGQIEVLKYITRTYAARWSSVFWKDVFLEASKVGRKDVMMYVHVHGLMKQLEETLQQQTLQAAAKSLDRLMRSNALSFQERPFTKFYNGARPIRDRRKEAEEAFEWLKTLLNQ